MGDRLGESTSDQMRQGRAADHVTRETMTAVTINTFAGFNTGEILKLATAWRGELCDKLATPYILVLWRDLGKDKL